MRKMENRTMKPSEESIPLITSYRLPRHRSRFFRTLLSYPLQIYACKKDSHLCKSFSFISSFLSRLCVAVSLSFVRPFAPSKDVLRLSRVTRSYRKLRHMKKDTYICKCLFLYQQLPILPGRFRPSTFGVCELNFRVRHGYG